MIGLRAREKKSRHASGGQRRSRAEVFDEFTSGTHFTSLLLLVREFNANCACGRKQRKLLSRRDETATAVLRLVRFLRRSRGGFARHRRRCERGRLVRGRRFLSIVQRPHWRPGAVP